MPAVARLHVQLPDAEKTILVPLDRAPRRLTDVLRGAGVFLNTRCGERGLCQGCEVELVSGRLVELDQAARTATVEAPGPIRGCQCGFTGTAPVTLRVPARSLLGHAPQVVSQFTLKVARASSPLGRATVLRAGSVGHSEAEVCGALAGQLQIERPVQCAAWAAAEIARLASDGDVHVALEYDGQRWQVAEVSHAALGRRLGAAIDIGTTTVVVLLVDLDTGDILAEQSAFNRQMQFGDDVVTRISLCAADPSMRGRLQAALLRDTLGPLLDQVLRQARRSEAEVGCVTAAGNTTMLHLLVGEDPGPMGTTPFTPAFLEHRRVRWAAPHGAPRAQPSAGGRPGQRRDDDDERADVPVPPTAEAARPWLHVLPGAAAYVGADVCAGVLASGLVYDDGPSLLVDVGTNGEIVLKHDGRMRACATAAGPAFEGCGLTCGVRAGAGAVGHVRLSPDPLRVHTEVIGGGDPVGICGSAYIDILGEGRRYGLLNRNGRFNKDALPPGTQPLLSTNASGRALQVASGRGGQPITVSEADIARLLQAKAAIAAGILTLLAHVDLAPREVRTLYLAGGFGRHVNPANAVACGLLPGFQVEQIEFLGNSSLAGAYLALLDASALDELKLVSERIEVVELNRDANFERRYIRQLRLP